MGEVVTSRRLSSTAPRFNHAAIRQYDLHREHQFAHRAVLHRRRTGCARCGHSTDGGVGTRINREEQSIGHELLRELLTEHACLDGAVEIVAAHSQDLVHT